MTADVAANGACRSGVSSVRDAANAHYDQWPEFLVLFARHNMYFNMRFQELESLAGFLGVTDKNALYVDRPLPTALSASPLALIRLPNEAAAHDLCQRAVLIKAVLEVWSSGPSYEEAVEAALISSEEAKQHRRSYLAPPKTFQIRVAAFGRTASMDDKRSIFDRLRPMFVGDEIADLKDPTTTIWALEEHSHETTEKTHLGPRSNYPQRVLICRQVAGGRSIDKKVKSGQKAYFQKYDLSNRAVLGPTTLDNELAFLMANCAQAKRGQVAFDPFCGTGGIMVAIGHFGTRLVGGEIDIRVIKGWRVAYTKNQDAAAKATRNRGFNYEPKLRPSESGETAESDLTQSSVVDGKTSPCKVDTPSDLLVRDGKPTLGKDIFTNFAQYGMLMPDIVVCDNSSRPWRELTRGWCDCIVTDPPYGVRAASKKQGREAGRGDVQHSATYIAPKVGYGEDELAEDLLNLASSALRDGGRLIFLQPVDLADFLGIDRAASERGGGHKGSFRDSAMPSGGRVKDPRLCISETTRDPLLLDEARYRDFIPSHVDIELIGASLQVLSGGLGRLLVIMSRKNRDEVGS